MDYKIRLVFTLARVLNCQKLHKRDITNDGYTWWLIPLSKWLITPVTNGISRVSPLIIGVISHVLSGTSHQVGSNNERSFDLC